MALTLQRVSGQPQLVDDVTRNVCLHQLPLLGMIFRGLQQMVKLFWIELLREKMIIALKGRVQNYISTCFFQSEPLLVYSLHCFPECSI